MEYVKNIKSIQFGVLSKEEVIKMSVVDVNSNRVSPVGIPNSVYDHRMGPMNYGEECPTCRLDTKDCLGHFGHVDLSVDVVHPLYAKFVLSFLRCFCHQCSRLLVTKDHLDLWGFLKYKNESRLKHILEKFTKIRFCLHCNTFQPHYTYSSVEGVFMANYKSSGLKEKLKVSVFEIRKIFEMISDDDIRLVGLNPESCRPINLVLSVLPVLPPRSRPFIVTDNSICDDDLTLSLNEIIKSNNYLKDDSITDTKRDKYIQTSSFRIKTLMDNCLGPDTPVLMYNKKIKMAKDIVIGDQLMGDDMRARNVLSVCAGHTERYYIWQFSSLHYIVTENHILTLLQFNPKTMKHEVVDVSVQDVLSYKGPYHYQTYNLKHTSRTDIKITPIGVGEFAGFTVDGNHRFLLGDYTVTHNSGKKAKHTNSRPMKGVKERLVSKEGLIRCNLMGKRVNHSARTVIGPDPTLRVNEIAIPPYFAQMLTFPEKVNDFNRNYLYELIRNGDATTVVRGHTKYQLHVLSEEKRNGFQLKSGDTVERKLRNGDHVMLNRQPSLHLGSILAMKVIIREGKTIRMNLAVTGSFNADFDEPLCQEHRA